MDRIGLLEEYKLVWDYSPEAEELSKQWHADRAKQEQQVRDMGLNEAEVFGRINVFAQRIVGHLALWLAPLPLTAAGVPATPAYVNFDAALDKDGKHIPFLRRAEGVDKEWRVEIPADWLKRAIEAAEYLIHIRTGLVPPPGFGLRGKIQNQIKKWVQLLRDVKWTELQRRAGLYKHDYDETEKCLKAVERGGLVEIKHDPSDSTNRRKWVIHWTGGGNLSNDRAWTENRGGKRPGAGKKKDTEKS